MSATGRTDPQAGFTLIEMLVVLAVIALISSLAFPAIERGLAGAELRAEVARTTAGLHAARNRAIARDEAVPFEPAVAPDGFRIESSAPIVFYGDGSASGGEILVRRGNGTGLDRRIVVNALTGQVMADPS